MWDSTTAAVIPTKLPRWPSAGCQVSRGSCVITTPTHLARVMRQCRYSNVSRARAGTPLPSAERAIPSALRRERSGPPPVTPRSLKHRWWCRWRHPHWSSSACGFCTPLPLALTLSFLLRRYYGPLRGVLHGGPDNRRKRYVGPESFFECPALHFPSPLTWASKFPSAAGSRQSPVDIRTDIVKSFVKAKPLYFKYSPDKVLSLSNSGYGWKVQVDGQGSELSGGPLLGTYILEQFHCHWGCSNDKGSEHTVDGQSFAGELHLVHWNTTKYSSFAEAANHTDGLAVLGVFLKNGAEHEELEKVASLLPQISFRGDSIKFPGTVDPAKFIPEDKNYWTYQGSLTTPPCTESVTWIIFKNPMQVSERQLNLFRNLRCHTKEQSPQSSGLIVNNYRPPLPLGNRELCECGSF